MRSSTAAAGCEEEMAGDSVSALSFHAPSRSFSRFCSSLFLWDALPPGFDEWVPAIDAHLLVRIRGTARMETLRGDAIALPDVALIGPLSGATRMIASEDYKAYGVGLRPAGLQAITRLSASEQVDTARPLEDFGWSSMLPVFLNRAQIVGGETPWAMLETVLLRWLDPAPEVDARATKITDWVRSSSNPPVAQLSEELGLSNRQTARVVEAIFGLNPKALSMRWRAHRAATALVLGQASSIDDACGAFYDQSHLIRDFRRFIGLTPTQLTRGGSLAHHAFLAAHSAGASMI
jgi:AraC-like DNA-binding protein